MVEQNPFKKGKSLIVKENNQRIRYLTDNEVDGLLSECPDYLRDIVECALNTGLRKSEILKVFRCQTSVFQKYIINRQIFIII